MNCLLRLNAGYLRMLTVVDIWSSFVQELGNPKGQAVFLGGEGDFSIS